MNRAAGWLVVGFAIGSALLLAPTVLQWVAVLHALSAGVK